MAEPKAMYVRVFCSTEDVNYEFWTEDESPDCPTDAGHTVGSVTILKEYSPQRLEIQEQDPEHANKGISRLSSRELEIPASVTGPVTVTQDYVVKYDISVLDIYWTSEAVNRRDSIEMAIGPQTSVATLAATGATGATEILVPNANVKYFHNGALITLYNGLTTDTQEIGEVIGMTGATTVLLDGTLNQEFPPTFTAVQRTVKPVDFLKFGPPMKMSIGKNKIGSSWIPANTPMRLSYTNNGWTGGGHTGAKEFSIFVEYLHG